MNKALPTAILAALVLAGCTITPTEQTADEAATRSLANPNDTRGRELEIWSDPRFTQQFSETYISASEIEPRITSIEREVMLEVIETLREAADLEAEARTAKQQEAIDRLNDENSSAATAVYDFTIGNIYFEQEQTELAEAAYREAVAKHRKFRRAWQALGMLYVRESQWDLAINAMTRVIELGGGNGITYGLMGFAYASTDNPLAAESAYRQAILLEPDRLDWKMGLARSFFRQQRFADAIALTGEMLKQDPSKTDLWLLQANAYLQLGDNLNAAENYLVVDQLGGANADILNNLGDIYINENLYDLAVENYIRALETQPDANLARSIQAAKVLTARAELDNTASLIEAIETHRAQDLDDQQQIDLLRMKARIAVANGASDQEADILREIVELDPLDGEALILLGQHESSKVGPAQAEIEAARLADNSDQLGNAQAQLAEHTAQATFYFERAAALEDFEADAYVRLAQLFVKLGNYEQALPLLRRAQQIKPRENVQQYLQQVERIARSG
ncbi:tetratricopeptide repeat protein [Mucisphaera sp.]|uniref:tetratricopeptide repeat protein n=1 Tax=Mucisphaera sp. TaxID=2913024 RepID=UPI003D0CB398